MEIILQFPFRKNVKQINILQKISLTLHFYEVALHIRILTGALIFTVRLRFPPCSWDRNCLFVFFSLFPPLLWYQTENIFNFLQAGKKWGCTEQDMFQTVDLYEERNMNQVKFWYSSSFRVFRFCDQSSLLRPSRDTAHCHVWQMLYLVSRFLMVYTRSPER